MITSVELTGLRGVREGAVRGLTALTVLTGRNGSGKSTVLDALLLASGSPDAALATVVRRRIGLRHPAAHLLGRDVAKAVVTAEHDARRVQIEISRSSASEAWLEVARQRGLPAPYLTFAWSRTPGAASMSARSQVFGSDGAPVFEPIPLPDGPRVSLVDVAEPTPLEGAFSECVRAGRRGSLAALVAQAAPPFDGLEILTESDGSPTLYLTCATGAVPVAAAGDGTQALLQVALALGPSAPASVVLLEEPEVYQHPGNLLRMGGVIAAAVAGGVQVILTTHSLELIDALVDAVREPSHLSVHRCALTDGALDVVRMVGAEARAARQTLTEDLR